jgi:hypothetical protein
MDKIQIYETVLLCLWLIISGVQVGISAAGGHKSEVVGKLIGFVLAALGSLPIVGRIYGWW